MTDTNASADRDPAENDGDGDEGLVAAEGVNETGAQDSPGASIGDPDQDGEADVEPNEPG